MTRWTVELELQAVRDLDRLDPVVARRILRSIYDRVAIADDPAKLGEPLAGPMKGLWRWRAGDYRILGRIEKARLVLSVAEAGHRGQIYR